jgi:hypothetical protein
MYQVGILGLEFSKAVDMALPLSKMGVVELP